jgi:VanZ family protein
MMAALFLASSGDVVALPGRSDLIAHLSAYFLLWSLSVRGFAGARWRGVTPRALWFGWLVSAGYGLSDELHQLFVDGRVAALDDWLADAAGGALGAFAAAAAARIALGRRARGREV